MSSRISTCRDALQLVRAGFSGHRRWLLALATAIGLSKCATFIPLILMPAGLGIGKAVWAPFLALLFFFAMAITMALDSLARTRHLVGLQSLLHLRFVQTILLVAGGIAVALHRLPENASLCLALGSCGALLMGAAQACSQLDVARTLARLDPTASDVIVCLSLAVTCCALLVCACLPWSWAAFLVALAPLAYRPLGRAAYRLAPPGALEMRQPSRKRRRPLPATLPRQEEPLEPLAPGEAGGPVEVAEHLLHAACHALRPLTIRRSAAVILLAVLIGMLALMTARASDPTEDAGTTLVGLAGLLPGLAIGLVATCRLALTTEPHTRTPMRAARICLPLLACAVAVAGLAPMAWPLVALLAAGALVVLDQALLVVSLPYLRLDDSEEGRTIATARTSQSVGAAAACGLFCFQTGELHPLPTLFLLISLLLVTFSLCVPVRSPWKRPGSGEPDGFSGMPGAEEAEENAEVQSAEAHRDPGAPTTGSAGPGTRGTGSTKEPPSPDGPLAELSAEQRHEEELARERAFYALPISLGDLTERQADVYVLAMRGYSSDEMCRELRITRSTINSHLQEIYRTFNVHSRTQLADVTGIILEEGPGLTEIPTLPDVKKKPRRRKANVKPKGTHRRPLLTTDLMEAMANAAEAAAKSEEPSTTTPDDGTVEVNEGTADDAPGASENMAAERPGAGADGTGETNGSTTAGKGAREPTPERSAERR